MSSPRSLGQTIVTAMATTTLVSARPARNDHAAVVADEVDVDAIEKNQHVTIQNAAIQNGAIQNAVTTTIVPHAVGADHAQRAPGETASRRVRDRMLEVNPSQSASRVQNAVHVMNRPANAHAAEDDGVPVNA